MKGGPSVEVLLDLALGEDQAVANEAAEVLKTQTFLYEADTSRLKAAHEARQHHRHRYSAQLRKG